MPPTPQRPTQRRPRTRASTRKRPTRKPPEKETPIELPFDSSDEDGKLYYRIGEVSRITDVKPYVLRYWESEFRWMSPQKSRSKQRLYRRRDIDMIQLIKKLLYEERYTIAGARQRLRELGIGKALEAATHAGFDPRAELADLRNELLAMRTLLED